VHATIRRALPRRPALAGALALALSGVLAATAAATWMLPPAPNRPKDFTVVKRDGHYHLFYIRHDNSLPDEQTEKDFGHAVSPDFYQWQHLPPVLPVREGAWDDDHVWAPSIIERDGVYYMFYTGVTRGASGSHLRQRTGLATSTDLVQWNRMDAPILGCEDVPWAWCDTLSGQAAFRDPFVMADPLRPGRWLMLTSAQPASDPTGMVVALAASDGDFTSWTDLGPMWITHQSWTYNPIVESPHILSRRDSLYYLFFTTSSGQPLSFATATDPAAPAPQWTYRGRLGHMLGVDAHAWFASEGFRDGLVDYLLFVDGDRIEVRRIAWRDDWRFWLAQPEPFHVQRMTWSAPTTRAGQVVTLRIEATFWYQQVVRPEVLSIAADGSETPVDPASLNLPSEIPLTGGVTEVAWLVDPRPGAPGRDTRGVIRLRLPDRTCVSPDIEILPVQDLTGGGDPPPVQPSPVAGHDGGVGGEEAGVPVLRRPRGLFGRAPSLLVDAPAETPGRLELFDLQGRRVRTLADRTFARGAHVLVWDGRDDAGRALGPGLYFARLATPAGARTARVLLR